METVVAGVVASLIAIVLWECYLTVRDNLRFHSLLGDYIGYGYVDDDANPLVRKPDSQSRAKVTRCGKTIRGFALTQRNILRIAVSEKTGRKWDGDIAMQNRTLGTVVWRYTDRPESDSFGAKWLTVGNEAGKVSLYMVESVRPKNFGKEVFIRDKPK